MKDGDRYVDKRMVVLKEPAGWGRYLNWCSKCHRTFHVSKLAQETASGTMEFIGNDLKPGQEVPSGRCPRCGGVTYFQCYTRRIQVNLNHRSHPNGKWLCGEEKTVTVVVEHDDIYGGSVYIEENGKRRRVA
jgi:hypothetical protein